MRNEIKLLAAIAIVVIIGAIIGSNYYRTSVQKQRVTSPGTGNSQNNSKASPETLIRPDSPTIGAANAKVTLVEFLDPECETCKALSPIVKKILKDYDGKVRLVVRYMPLHPNSVWAGTFTEAAGEQGKYWQAQDLLFQRQQEWGEPHDPSGSTPKPDLNALFEKYAVELGLDLEKMRASGKESRHQAKLDRDRRDGQSLGVRQTPSFFVNGRQLVRLGESELRALIDDELRQ